MGQLFFQHWKNLGEWIFIMGTFRKFLIKSDPCRPVASSLQEDVQTSILIVTLKLKNMLLRDKRPHLLSQAAGTKIWYNYLLISSTQQIYSSSEPASGN